MRVSRRQDPLKLYAVGDVDRAGDHFSLNDVFGWHFWAGGHFEVIGDTSEMMNPLIVKVDDPLAYDHHRLYTKEGKRTGKGTALGVGMAIGFSV